MCYTYDSLSRVTKRTTKNHCNAVLSEESYSYDAAGNITDAPDSCFGYDTNNRLTVYDGKSVSHDLDGNILNNGVKTFTYDSANRLLSAGKSTYAYNAEDVRIYQHRPNADTTYVYDTNCRLSKLLCKTTGGVVTKYVYGKGLIGEEVSGAFKTYHFDSRGSTVAITNASGNITDTFAYDTYGKLLSRTGTNKVIFRYNGRDGVITDDNELIYMRARYYSPKMRRFINADIVAGAISNAITLNRFAYANGNPVSFVDPFGLSPDNRWKLANNFYDTAYNVYEAIDIAVLSQMLIQGNVHFERRVINGVEKIIVFGKNNVVNNTIVDIPQRIINADNLPKYQNIGKYMDVNTAVKDSFSSYSNIVKRTAKASDYLGVAGDILGIVMETGYQVSQYEDDEDKWIVGGYTVVTEAVSSVVSTATSAVATSVATTAITAAATKLGSALGTAIAPGIGTLIGFGIGLLAGLVVDKIFDVVQDNVIDTIVENN